MKNLKLTVWNRIGLTIIIIAMYALITSVSAQGPGGPGGQGRGGPSPEERAKRQTERMKEELKLTAAQEPRVLTINLKYAKKMDDVRKIADTAVQRKTFQKNLSLQETIQGRAHPRPGKGLP
jgi:hypothetical protein